MQRMQLSSCFVTNKMSISAAGLEVMTFCRFNFSHFKVQRKVWMQCRSRVEWNLLHYVWPVWKSVGVWLNETKWSKIGLN